MKTLRTIFTTALLGLSFTFGSSAFALDVDKAPVTTGDVTEATINGVRVLVKRVPGAELVATNLYIRGGARNWGKDDAGVESLADEAKLFAGRPPVTFVQDFHGRLFVVSPDYGDLRTRRRRAPDPAVPGRHEWSSPPGRTRPAAARGRCRAPRAESGCHRGPGWRPSAGRAA